MRKVPLMLLSIIWVLSACSSNTTTETTEEAVSKTETNLVDEKYKIYSLNNMEYSIPESWTEDVRNENQKHYHLEDGLLMIDYDELDGSFSLDEERAEYIEAFTSGFDSSEFISESKINVAGRTAYLYDFTSIISDDKHDLSIVIFDYGDDAMFLLVLGTLSHSDKDYSNEFENILSSIKLPDKAESDDQNIQAEHYFDGTDLITEDYKITITDYKVIQPGDTGNEYGETAIIAFWYDTTVAENVSDTEYNPTTLWISSFEAIQDNDPNIINKLNIGSHPDNTYLDSQLTTIKPGGTVTNAVAYKLTDLETPVTLNAFEKLFSRENIGSYDFQIQ